MHTTKDASRLARRLPMPDEVALAKGGGRIGNMLGHEHDGEQQPLLVTVDEAAKMLRIGRTVAYQLMQKGEIRSVKIGRIRRVVATSIGEYVERLVDDIR